VWKDSDEERKGGGGLEGDSLVTKERGGKEKKQQRTKQIFVCNVCIRGKRGEGKEGTLEEGEGKEKRNIWHSILI